MGWKVWLCHLPAARAEAGPASDPACSFMKKKWLEFCRVSVRSETHREHSVKCLFVPPAPPPSPEALLRLLRDDHAQA